MLNTRNIVITVNIYHRLNVCDFGGPAKFSSSIHSTMQFYLFTDLFTHSKKGMCSIAWCT